MEFQASLQKAYLDKSSVPKIYDNIKGKSLTSIRKELTVPISAITKNFGRMESERFVCAFLLKLAVELNLHNKTNDSAVSAIAEDVYDIGYRLSPEELAFFFKKIRRGDYGPMYENFNSNNICKALNEFVHERDNFFAVKNRDNHNAFKPKSSASRSSSEAVDFKKASKSAMKSYQQQNAKTK